MDKYKAWVKTNQSMNEIGVDIHPMLPLDPKEVVEAIGNKGVWADSYFYPSHTILYIRLEKV